ncbi:MAG: DEAD/DEAH box helicase [Deltaproteobacteria bacterium]|nr:DEAD/DEAH box helicase [Deltaproteobacteria bacterium]
MPSDIHIQIERRRQRGLKEITRIVNKGHHPIFSLFEVSSVSEQTYRVQLRSLADLQNTCTCPDYKTNLIGTCKHIEGVLLHLEKKYGDRLQKLARKPPRGTQIYLHYGVDETVRVGLPLPKQAEVRELLSRYFDPSGLLTGSPLRSLPALFAAIEDLPIHLQPLVQVDEAVREYLELLQDQEIIGQQKAWFIGQVKRGNRSLDLLSSRLYPYQEEGALHLAFGRRAMLADDMGLGKTVQAIAASALLKELRDIGRVLVICPASLKHQWAREIRRFTSLPVTVVEGNLKTRRLLYRKPTFFAVVNYEIVLRDLQEIERLQPDLIILDEAQRIKNWRTKTATAVKQLRSRYAFVLTGTPLENRIDELYSIFQFIDARILGPLWHFNDRFYQLEKRPSGTYKVLGYQNLDELRGLIAPYILRRTRKEVLQDLPERTDNNFFVEMTAPQTRAYDEFKETVAKLAAIAKRRPLTPKERDILLNCLVKMRIICNALALHDKEIPPKDHEKTAPKLRELRQILYDEIVGNGHKAIVFSQWTGMLNLTEPVIRRLDLAYVKLTGEVPSAKRGALIQRFFEDPDCRLFLSTDAGGVGLNLQAASLVINLDLPWNPAVLEQRIARAHRHGQKRSVQVINLVAQGTIEERMLDTLATKRNVFAGIFGTEEAPTSISFEDTGQALLKELDKLVAEPTEVEIELEPSLPEVAVESQQPTLKGFADLLLARLQGRLLRVRKAPMGKGILVVLDSAPAKYRPLVEAAMRKYFGDVVPDLHLMEEEGYQSLTAFLPAGVSEAAEEVYRAPALPSPLGPDGRELVQQRREKAGHGIDMAGKRLAFAQLVLEGGFPEEFMRPLREALGWGYFSLLALYGEADPASDLPSPRLIQSELVEKGHLPEELAMRLARVRELSEPPAEDETAPPPSIEAAETMLEAVQSLIELGQQKVVEIGL